MKILRLSLIALVMSGFVLYLFGSQPAEATIFNRCQVVNTIMEHNSPAWDRNCFFKIRDIVNTTVVNGKTVKVRGFRYEQMQIHGREYCIAQPARGTCDKKCEDLQEQIDIFNITCSKITVRFIPPPLYGGK